jgi:diaminohydroxyphosphoribosylaminopyrimidine deaminase/5-amino-6-(5-phosphoribosylamino)uracil reductase
MELDHEAMMRLAIAEGERARGSTGDNPWVGCVLVSPHGEVLARGHTQGPGEDHAEIAALAAAKRRGLEVAGTTMYSTLEPCSFHGRTPACSRVLIEHRIGHLVFGMRDPHPRVDGEGAAILQRGGVAVTEGICEAEVRRQLGQWVFTYHPHEPRRRARALRANQPPEEVIAVLASLYAVAPAAVAALLQGDDGSP